MHEKTKAETAFLGDAEGGLGSAALGNLGDGQVTGVGQSRRLDVEITVGQAGFELERRKLKGAPA